jgi:malonate decarboxylase epsilon subunit
MSVAFLFPGQGAQNEGLLHYLPQHPEVTRTIAEARTLLRQDIGALDRCGSDRALDRRRRYGRTLMAENVLPAVVAGMSIGAFGAAVACGTMSFECLISCPATRRANASRFPQRLWSCLH